MAVTRRIARGLGGEVRYIPRADAERLAEREQIRALVKAGMSPRTAAWKVRGK